MKPAARIGLYLADQHWQRTLSKGIYGYSRTLAHELVARARRPPVLIVNRANRADMRGGGAEAEEAVLPAASATGLLRLLADQVAAPLLGMTRGLDLLHFPKGFLPAWSGSVRMSATVHDLIPLHYAERHPGHFSAPKLGYLRWSVLNTLRQARGVMTDSRFSADAILALARSAGRKPPPIEVVYPVADPALVDGEVSQPADATRLVHLGSALPHKRTRETIAAFRAWNAGRRGAFRLSITGLSALPPAWGVDPGPDLVLAGTVDVRGLRELLAGSRALLLLSSIEGFGLPAIEAWSLGTPVCFLRTGSLPEVLAGLPGGHDGDADFGAALDELLALRAEERQELRARVRARFDRAVFGRTAVDLLERWAER